MARSPSRSSDGGSEHQQRVEPRLLKAVEEHKNAEAIAIIEEAKAKSQPIDHLLRIALMRAADKGNVSIAEYLLKNGAKPDGAAGGRVSPLLKAIERQHTPIVQVLLKHGGNVNVADKQGRTALMTAAWMNYFHIVEVLLRWDADVNKKDNKGRNVLHNLAADKHCNWGKDVIDALLQTNIAIDGEQGQDDLKRSPLHWAAVTGKRDLCEWLLMRPKPGVRANVNAVEIREKTSLHLAVAHQKEDIVELLIKAGANIKAKSDGSWTALHNACEVGNVKIVKALLTSGADLNARLLNGSTPLHLAAQNGHVGVVSCLLECKDIKRTARDTFGITPFLRAAQNKNKDIVKLLAPSNHVDRLSKDALAACQGFNATIVDFGHFHNENRVRKRTVYELLYANDPVNPRKPAVPILPTDSKATDFRWIHLPANNMTWVEALLTKAFIEEGANDVNGFKALERSFNHQHRGQQIHSHFMRPLCQITPRAPRNSEESEYSDGADQGPPKIVVSEGTGLGINAFTSGQATAAAQEYFTPKTPVRTETISTDQTNWTQTSNASASAPDRRSHGKGKEKYKKTPKGGGGGGASRGAKGGGTDTPTKYTKPSKPLDHHARKATTQSMTSSGQLRSPGSPGRRDANQAAKGNIFMFMPYLHFETDRGRQEMQAAIALAQQLKRAEKKDDRHIALPPLNRKPTYDELLIRAHLSSSTVSLHVRRTLDQFFYHNIDTQSRDQDQVVYRYQTKNKEQDDYVDPKIFMVDQLWMWVLGKDLIVTSFPQRWQQPRNDPLNVLDAIIEEINSVPREPIRSVYDLAVIITGRCSGVFDRTRMDEDYQFLDMFESSIGDATEEETKLFREFNLASAQASQWLQHHRRPNRFSRQLEAEGRVIEHQNRHVSSPHNHSHALAANSVHEEKFKFDDNGPIHAPLFVDKLLDIGAETDLLAETKDIRDELNMISKVLEDQLNVLPALELSILDIFHKEHKNQQEIKRGFRDQRKTVEMHLKDIDRMDKQAERIYKSITDLLDLKQKHANAFEARFARDQAAGTARQSQTIMVFTIVTIIFLPLSFIAALFTINIREFPHQDGGSEPSLPLSYVSKYMFGIGFAISIPLVALALSVDTVGDYLRESKRRVREIWSGKHRNSHTAGPSSIKHDSNPSVEFINMHTLEQALSTTRSMRERRSYDTHVSYTGHGMYGAPLLPVTSRGTAQTAVLNGLMVPNGKVEVDVRPVAVERQSTGFKIRRSMDV
ncbi:hypothetical protein B0J11DRAFT_345204 [Dendryphion nanum]|uniref:Ankyrin repeat protein n=1 Tax=Dendryphion nanum TaxID=256645 RepID=A0A9P9DNY9_9PLEO|nr:hypothetical protein B0J11DRAFT_345204 [Dendryphion nanum]